MTSKNVSEDLVRQDRKLLAQLVELMPLSGLATSEKQAIIDGRGGAAHWVAWQMRRYADMRINPRILYIDRSVKFDPKIMAAGAFDKEGGEWSANDLCSSLMQAIPEIIVDNVHLEPMSLGQQSQFNLLDARVLQAFLKQKGRIPEEWKMKKEDKETCILFTGTALTNTYGQACYAALRWIGWEWRKDCFTEDDLVKKARHYCFMRAVYSL